MPASGPSSALPRQAGALAAIRVTKDVRSAYDHYMLHLHDAMKAILPNAVFIGFTGTPIEKNGIPSPWYAESLRMCDCAPLSSVATVIRRGQHGSGPWRMPPHPEISAAEARTIEVREGTPADVAVLARRRQSRPNSKADAAAAIAAGLGASSTVM